MEYTVAQRVKGILVSSGHNDEKRREGGLAPFLEEREAARKAYEELGQIGTGSTRFSSGEYFTSDPDGDAAVVAYQGSVYRESERLRLYRLAIENCGYRAVEQDDPSREGRRILKVVKA